MTDKYVEVGPWGGDHGTKPWRIDQLDVDRKLTKITISVDATCVYSIMLTYIDSTGENDVTYGASGGQALEPAVFTGDEQLNEIDGTYGDPGVGRVVITSLTFKTNYGTYGPYGPGGGTPFSLPLHDAKLGGFFGKHGNRLDNLGVKLIQK